MSLVAYAALLATSQVAIDGDGRVLDASERPIPGLYAAGCVTGGLDGGRPSATSTAC
jgi:predicted oxidoreductase